MSENKTTELVKAEENTHIAPIMPFSNAENFAMAQRMANALSNSTLIPETYRGSAGLPNCLIALEMAQRVGMSPFMVMQNMHVIQGRPSWSATYLIGAINTSGKFSPLRFRLEQKGKKKVDYTTYSWATNANGKNFKQPKKETTEIDETICIAYATELSTGEILEGPAVSISMAVMEGWYTKDGSKWQTMPELMLRYRSAAFFSRMYCPEVAMGLHTAEEVYDVVYDTPPAQVDTKERAKNITEALLAEPVEEEVETEFLPPEVVAEPEPKVVEQSSPKAKAKPEPTLPSDDAFDFPEADDDEEGGLF